jgi:hypothetical protein
MHVKLLYRPDIRLAPYAVSANPAQEYIEGPTLVEPIMRDMAQDLPELLCDVHLTGPKDKTPLLGVIVEVEVATDNLPLAYEVTVDEAEVTAELMAKLPSKVRAVIRDWYGDRKIVTPGDFRFLFNGHGFENIGGKLTVI